MGLYEAKCTLIDASANSAVLIIHFLLKLLYLPIQIARLTAADECSPPDNEEPRHATEHAKIHNDIHIIFNEKMLFFIFKFVDKFTPHHIIISNNTIRFIYYWKGSDDTSATEAFYRS